MGASRGGFYVSDIRAIIAWSIKSMAVLLAFGSILLPASVSAEALPSVQAKAAELIDAESGQVLFSLNPKRQLPMASVTKLMTLYLAFRAIDQGRVHLSERVFASEAAHDVKGSQIWLAPGEQMTVDHLLRAVAVGSANDAAYALGEFLGGSEPTFVVEMNRTARSLGMTGTHFSNPHGLSQTGHYATAEDLAKLARAAVDTPRLLSYTRMWEDRSVRDGKGGKLWLINQNRLLRQFPGADGLKTGYTTEAGYCIVATARRGSTRMIAVVLGAPSSKARFEDAASMMSWGFTHYRTLPVAKAHQNFGWVPVKRGQQSAVGAIAAEGLALTVARQSPQPFTVQAKLSRQVTAPVRRGQPLGTLTVKAGPAVVASRPLVASRSVAHSPWVSRVLRYTLKIVG